VTRALLAGEQSPDAIAGRPQSRALTRNPHVVFASAPAAGNSDIARAGELPQLSRGLPAYRPRTRGWRDLTRYADDLAFSGGKDFVRIANRFSLHVAAILYEEGHEAHHRKTRIMRQGVRQYLAGTVVNERLNIPRPDYDRLNVILTNCLRHGPASQNREGHPAFRSHLEGRISFVHMVSPAKAVRLRALYDEIDWQ